jgi:hypothetical protein
MPERTNKNAPFVEVRFPAGAKLGHTGSDSEALKQATSYQMVNVCYDAFAQPVSFMGLPAFIAQPAPVARNAPRLIARHEVRCRSPATLILEIDIGTRVVSLPVTPINCSLSKSTFAGEIGHVLLYISYSK